MTAAAASSNSILFPFSSPALGHRCCPLSLPSFPLFSTPQRASYLLARPSSSSSSPSHRLRRRGLRKEALATIYSERGGREANRSGAGGGREQAGKKKSGSYFLPLFILLVPLSSPFAFHFPFSFPPPATSSSALLFSSFGR